MKTPYQEMMDQLLASTKDKGQEGIIITPSTREIMNRVTDQLIIEKVRSRGLIMMDESSPMPKVTWEKLIELAVIDPKKEQNNETEDLYRNHDRRR